MKTEIVSLGIIFREVAMELAHRLAEEHLEILRNAAVRMEFHKKPFGPAANVNAEACPKTHSITSRRVRAGQIAVLDLRQETELASAPVQAKRTLNEKKF